jgi:23S rRNA pseudouridine1911/1915/1917 synthase
MLDIVYEDADLLVVNKPAGVVIHPAYRHPDDTLWNALLPLFHARGIPDGPHLLHRLDRDTSGLLCVPKQPDAHRRLARALQNGAFVKGYLALVHGTPGDLLTIDAPLGRDPLNRRFVRVLAGGKPARTHARVLRRWPGFALLRVDLATGRTHQIRVHLGVVGYPIAGDVLYGPQPPVLSRLFLHAATLHFPHPSGQHTVRCRCPLPPDLLAALHTLTSEGHGAACRPCG